MGNIKLPILKLFSALAFITCGWMAVQYWQNSKLQTKTIVIPPDYEHSLIVDAKRVHTYRSPAAIARREGSSLTNTSTHPNDIPETNDDTYKKQNKDRKKQTKSSPSGHNETNEQAVVQNTYLPSVESNPASTNPTAPVTNPSMSFFGGQPNINNSAADNAGQAGTGDSSSSRAGNVEPTPKLSGRIKPLIGAISSYRSNFIIESAYAAINCTNPRLLLLDLVNMSVLLDNPIATTALPTETTFNFDPRELGLNLTRPTRYMLQTTGCTLNFQRIITSFYDDQDLDQITTLISKVINTRVAGSVPDTDANSLSQIYAQVTANATNTDDFTVLYQLIDQTAGINNIFQGTFNAAPLELLQAAPDITGVTYHNQLQEGQTSQYAVSMWHWNPTAQLAVEWQIEGNTVATTANWDYTPLKDSPATQVITLIVGHKDGITDLVDRTMPYHSINFQTTIADLYPAQAPIASIIVNPTTTRSIQIEINTGIENLGIFTNCDTFSSFAIVENGATPQTSDFIHTCSQANSQTINYTIQHPSDGEIPIQIWSRDAAGRISIFSTNLIADLDSTAPLLSFENMQTDYRSDEVATIYWRVTEAHSLSSLEYSIDFFDGSTWSNLPNVPSTNGNLINAQFETELLMPNINATNAKMRLSFTDSLGQSNTIESSVFDIARPILGSTPSLLDLSSILNKQTTAVLDLDFTNTGNADTKICGPVVLGGTHASEFSIITDGCGASTITIGGSCRISISATPQIKGTRSASASITCGNDTFTTPLTVLSLNNAPTVAALTTLTIAEDSVLAIDFGSSTDTDTDVLTYTILSGPSNGSLSSCGVLAGRYVCNYQAGLNYYGTDTITYKANDGSSDSNIGTVNITIYPVNDAPVLTGPQAIATNEDTLLNFQLNLATDVDLDTLNYSLVSGVSQGILNCDWGTSRNCTYTPSLNYNGSDSFTFKANDGALDSNTITVNITVNAINDPPVVGANQSFSTNEDTAFNFTLNSGSDIDIPAQTLSYQIVSAPLHGVVSNCISTGGYSTDLTCTYTPTNNYFGADSFTYKVYDSVSDSISVATVNLTINPINDAPVLLATQSVATNEDTLVNFTLNLASDVELDPLTYSIVTNVSQGVLNCTGTSCSYTPAADFVGDISFTYKANDGFLDSNNATVTISVSNLNDPPVIGANQTINTNEDVPVAFTINAATDIDLPAQTLSYIIITMPTKGSLSGCINNATYQTSRNCTYTPFANDNGSDSFTCDV